MKEVKDVQSCGLEKLFDAAGLSMDLLYVKEDELSQITETFRGDALRNLKGNLLRNVSVI